MNIENTFENLGLSKNVLKSIEALKYTTPSPIQKELIPIILNGEDAFGQAQTGTGKTLAFAASILSKLDKETDDVKAIILSPTRELAKQITKEFNELDKNKNFKTATVYGGDSIERQIRTLRSKVDIVVGTPGRVKDLIQKKKLNLTKIKFFVLDEADEMLNMGFLEDIKLIFSKTAGHKQVLMLSATLSEEIKKLTKTYMDPNAKFIKIKSKEKTNNNVEQSYYLINEKQRFKALCRIIDIKNAEKIIIFAKTRSECDRITTQLVEIGYNAEVMHGEIAQRIREKTLDKFKNGRTNILVATDVAARGIHVNDVGLIINYNLPQDNEAYVHRIGRTGRASNKGEAVTLINNKEERIIKGIAKFANCQIIEQIMPEGKEIKKMKYENIVTEAKEIVKNDNLDESLEYIRDLNKSDLMNFAAALLKYSVDKEIKSDLKTDFSVEKRKARESVNGQTRVFINVGKMDGLKMGSLLDLIKETTKIDKDHFNNIEVLQSFTFIDVTDAYVNEFIEKFSGIQIKNRTVRIEISNNKASGIKKRKYNKSENSNKRDYKKSNFKGKKNYDNKKSYKS